MKRLISIVTILFISSCGVQRVPVDELNTLEPITLYETSEDFLNKKSMDVNLGILIKDKSPQHITTEGVFDLTTGEKSKKGISAWAINFNSENYFNLGYSDDVNHWGSYAKFDIEGKYCAIIIDENSPNILKSTSNVYGGGLTGALIAESRKWGKNWKDENGVKKKLLFIDNQNVKNKMMNRNQSSHGNYLTKKQFEKIVEETGMNFTEDKIKDIEFEKILKVIKTANN